MNIVPDTLLRLLADAIQDTDQVGELDKIGVYHSILVELDDEFKVKLRQACQDDEVQKKIIDMVKREDIHKEA